jgi:DNA-binding beta-propeller fold protein YncE
MRRLGVSLVAGVVLCGASGSARQAPGAGPYSVVRTAKVGGLGGFDYIYADTAGRRLYIPRKAASGDTPTPARVTVFDLDTLAHVGDVANTSANGAAVDPASGHGFASSKPVTMWDTKTLAVLKTIDVEGGPDGILFDPFNERVHVFSHGAPNDTVINAKDGTVIGTIDLGGAPEQAVTDGKGHLYVDIEDKATIAVVDAKTMAVTARYDLSEKGSTPAGLALDVKNGILFAACRTANPAVPGKGVMVIVSAADGKILTALPLAGGSDGAVFNPATLEAFSSHGNGTMTIIKEQSPTSFTVEQDLATMNGAKTLTLDAKTNHVITMTAEYGPAPAPTAPPPPGTPPGRGGPRPPMLPDSFSILVVGK